MAGKAARQEEARVLTTAESVVGFIRMELVLSHSY